MPRRSDPHLSGIVAAVLLATFNFGFGAELTFNQCLAVCMYSCCRAY